MNGGNMVAALVVAFACVACSDAIDNPAPVPSEVGADAGTPDAELATCEWDYADVERGLEVVDMVELVCPNGSDVIDIGAGGPSGNQSWGTCVWDCAAYNGSCGVRVRATYYAHDEFPPDVSVTECF